MANHDKPVATKTFEDEMILEGSWGERDLGKHKSTMEFYETDDAGKARIEWDIPTLDRCEEIGLWFEMRDGKRALTDYDGIFSLPAQAVELIESLGIIVDQEFKS